MQAIQAFNLTPTVAAAHVLALHQLMAANAASSPHDADWAARVLSCCEGKLAHFVEACSKGQAGCSDAMGCTDWLTATAIFTAGEVNALCFIHGPHDL